MRALVEWYIQTVPHESPPDIIAGGGREDNAQRDWNALQTLKSGHAEELTIPSASTIGELVTSGKLYSRLAL